MMAATARLTIETLDLDHAPGLFAALDDGRVGRYIGGPDVTTRDALVDRIALLRRGAPVDSGETWLNWAVCLTDEVIGRIEATLHDGIAEIAYVFGPTWWGHGFATEATGWLLGELRTTHDVSEFWATVDPDNDPSRRVLERLGFELTPLPGHPAIHSFDEGDLVFSRTDDVNEDR